jgi:hypothetical protein
MSLPEDINTRAMNMWRAISQNVNFRKKNVADLGCGHGEMLWRSLLAGADFVCGFDIQPKPNALMLAEIYSQIRVVQTDLNVSIGHGTPYWLKERKWDIAMCFSVLPYLDNPIGALEWIAKNFPVALIEVQYVPEPNNIGVFSDNGMFSTLRDTGFEVISKIGSTHVGIRDMDRTIWKCERKSP